MDIGGGVAAVDFVGICQRRGRGGIFMAELVTLKEFCLINHVLRTTLCWHLARKDNAPQPVKRYRRGKSSLYDKSALEAFWANRIKDKALIEVSTGRPPKVIGRFYNEYAVQFLSGYCYADLERWHSRRGCGT